MSDTALDRSRRIAISSRRLHSATACPVPSIIRTASTGDDPLSNRRNRARTRCRALVLLTASVGRLTTARSSGGAAPYSISWICQVMSRIPLILFVFIDPTARPFTPRVMRRLAGYGSIRTETRRAARFRRRRFPARSRWQHRADRRSWRAPRACTSPGRHYPRAIRPACPAA